MPHRHTVMVADLLNQTPEKDDMWVWWINNIVHERGDGKPIIVPVYNLSQASVVLFALTELELHQESIITWYQGGLMVYSGTSWEEWVDPETGKDIIDFLSTRSNMLPLGI